MIKSINVSLDIRSSKPIFKIEVCPECDGEGNVPVDTGGKTSYFEDGGVTYGICPTCQGDRVVKFKFTSERVSL
tara:strand:+ start:1064 stop:1285 length:222 start_codon:yes stop_codon:yes gene_type:complete